MPTSLQNSRESSLVTSEDSAVPSQDSFSQLSAANINNDPFHRAPSPDEGSNTFDRSDSSEHSFISPKPVVDSGYIRQLERNHSLQGDLFKNPPRNLGEVRAALRRPRNDTSLTEKEQSVYDTNLATAQLSNEAFLKQSILDKLLDFSDLFSDPNFVFRPEIIWSRQHIISVQLGQPFPDYTLGIAYRTKCSHYEHTFDDGRDYSRQLLPVPNVVCPLLTIEVGLRGEAELQNRHNGICMLRNLFELKRAAGLQERGYRNKVQALTIEVTPESLQVSCHWMDDNGHFRSARVEPPSSLFDREGTRRIALNAIDWVKRELGALDDMLFNKLEAKATKSRKRQRSKSPTAGRGRRRRE